MRRSSILRIVVCILSTIILVAGGLYLASDSGQYKPGAFLIFLGCCAVAYIGYHFVDNEREE